MRRLYRLGALALAPSVLFISAVRADDTRVHVHGFISQAAVYSDGNNVYGDSQHGSTDFFEAAINANWRVNNALSFAGQLLSRDAGRADNGDVKVDYLFGDYKVVESERSGMGFRFGRVRNSFGFYNETRDVIFTRPTIISPQAVYFEGNGLREILFSSDGAQLYSYWDDDRHSTSLSLTYGRDKSLSQDVIENITGGPSGIRKADIESPLFAQILHSRNGGRSRFALSLTDVTLRSTETLPFVPATRLDAAGFVLSAEQNWARISLTGEYSYLNVSSYAGAIELQDSISESVYIQSRLRFTPSITGTLRFEFGHNDDDQSGSDSLDRRWVAGLQWLPTPAWILALDVYDIHGTGGIPGVDNVGRILEKHTTVVAAMLGFRF